jgi:DNA-binding helix-hairpin-helix protein with protein kinase domain
MKNNAEYVSPKFGRVYISTYKLGTEGAEGAVLQVDAFRDNQSNLNAKDYCAKLYAKKTIEGKKRGEREKKIATMLKHALDDGPKWSYGWPLSELKQSDRFSGFLMKRARQGSISLGEFTFNNAAKLKGAFYDFDDTQGRKNRLRLICNIAAGVKGLHAAGHVLVDFKPSNILVHPPTGEIMFVDLDSLQLSKQLGKFLAPLGTPEYMPPEAYVDPADQLRVNSWDYFSMAVIFYQMLTGIHPYCGTPKEFVTGVDTLEDKIKSRMYVGGAEAKKYDVIPKPHNRITNFYKDLQPLFGAAFEGPAAQRPSAEKWGLQIFELIKKLP